MRNVISLREVPTGTLAEAREVAADYCCPHFHSLGYCSVPRPAGKRVTCVAARLRLIQSKILDPPRPALLREFEGRPQKNPNVDMICIM